MYRKFLIGFLLFISFLLPVSTCSAFTHVVSFGDSLSDNGLNVDPDNPFVLLDDQGFARFTNGWVWVEYLAEKLGATHDGRAYGGATTGDGPVNLRWQIDQYAGQIANDSTLFTLWAGGNDLRGIDPSALPGDPSFAPAVINAALANIDTAVRELYAKGARQILIPNLPDLGITPENYGNFAATMASSWFNFGYQSYGISGLADVITGLRGAYADLTIYELDIFNIINDEILGQGYFPNETEGWLGSGENVADYLFYDDIHPTTDAHWLIADYAANAVPVPSAILLLGSGLLFLIRLKRD